MTQQRDEKAAHVSPVHPEKAEATFYKISDNELVERLMNGAYSGLGLTFGGLYQGSGFALGPTYKIRGLLRENLNLSFFAVGSIKKYYRLGAEISMPHLFDDRMRLDYHVYRDDAPQVDSFGPGNNSSAANRTTYRFESVTHNARLGVKPFRKVLTISGDVGYGWINTGPGKGSDGPSIEKVFTPATTPGIDFQTNFLRFGPDVEIDFRDNPGLAHRGSYFRFSNYWYQDQQYHRYSFRRVYGTMEHYIPFFNEKRVIALRALVDLSYTNGTNQVPFYMQRTLGGPNDLRGWMRFRYTDNNLMLMNGEYRWEVAPALDMAVFADAGKVMPKPGQMSFSELHADAGFGFRFKSRSATFMRIDVGFSPDGVQFWWTFDDIFKGILQRSF